MVSGTVPVEVSVTAFVTTEFRGSAPNPTLVALKPNVGTGPLSCSRYVSKTPPESAVSVTVCVPLIADTVAVNTALAAPAGTVTEPGTFTALLLLVSAIFRLFTTSWFSVTVQLSVPAAGNELVLHDNPVSWVAAPNEAWGNATAKQANIRPGKPARFSFICQEAPRARSNDPELVVSASSAAIARPRGGGTSFEYISVTPQMPKHTPPVRAQNVPAAPTLLQIKDKSSSRASGGVVFFGRLL
jgi:hypothetical protein